jgi:hypothetical protein
VAAKLKKAKELIPEGMEIIFNEDHVYAVTYPGLHPQTKAFIERFDLDLRLFDRSTSPKQEVLNLGSKRSFD